MKCIGINKSLVRDLVNVLDPEIVSVCHFFRNIKSSTNILDECLILADKNVAEAQYVLSKIFQWGLMCQVNKKESLKWCEIAVENQFIPAYFQMANFYDSGWVGLKKNKSKTIQLILKAASYNYIPAINVLGFFYNYGYKVKKDILKSIEFYSKAIKFGDSKAMYCLSQIYIMEPEFLNIEKGMRLLKDSVNENYPEAHYALGNMYRLGENGLQKNIALCRKHIDMEAIIKNEIVDTCLKDLRGSKMS